MKLLETHLTRAVCIVILAIDMHDILHVASTCYSISYPNLSTLLLYIWHFRENRHSFYFSHDIFQFRGNQFAGYDRLHSFINTRIKY